MPSDTKKNVDQSGASDTSSQQTLGESAIEDLSPNDGEANDVRGGALPPEGLRLGVLPPDELRLVPPST